MTHTPLDIRHSLGTRCLVKTEGSELSKRRKTNEQTADTPKGKRILIVFVYLKLYPPLQDAVNANAVHRGQSVVLNSAFCLAEEIPDPPQYCRHFY